MQLHTKLTTHTSQAFSRQINPVDFHPVSLKRFKDNACRQTQHERMKYQQKSSKASSNVFHLKREPTSSRTLEKTSPRVFMSSVKTRKCNCSVRLTGARCCCGWLLSHYYAVAKMLRVLLCSCQGVLDGFQGFAERSLRCCEEFHLKLTSTLEKKCWWMSRSCSVISVLSWLMWFRAELSAGRGAETQ